VFTNKRTKEKSVFMSEDTEEKNDWKFSTLPERDKEWKMYLFGSRDTIYVPEKGQVPNFIVRYAMRLIGCRWEKTK
jgi:hypothetical protein